MNVILKVDNVETQIFYISCLKNQNLDPANEWAFLEPNFK